MVYKNKFEITPSQKKEFAFDKFSQPIKVSTDEGSLSYKDGVECYNFSVKDNTLKNGYGVKDLTLTITSGDYAVVPNCTEVKDLWTVKWLNNTNQLPQDYIFYMLNDNKIYYSELSLINYIFPMDTTFNAVPTMTKIRQNGVEAFVFTSPSDNLVLLNQLTETAYSAVPKVMDACYHYGKLFAITAQTRNALVYSTDTEVTNWTSSNTQRIDFPDERGRLLKLMIFNDNLYVFREFGITKVTPYSMNSDFSIDHLYQSSSYIYPDTISICGEKVIFLTRDGLYSFNGNNVEKLDIDCLTKVERISTSEPSAIGFQRKYFLACKMNFDESTIGCESGTYKNNAVIIIDCDTNEIEIMRGVDVKKFASINSAKYSKLCVLFNGTNKNRIGEITETGTIFSSSYTKKWRSAYTDFGYADKLKRIYEIRLIARSNCSVKIESDEETKSYSITGSTKLQRIKSNVKGKIFKVSFISSASGQKISNAKISMMVYQ